MKPIKICNECQLPRLKASLKSGKYGKRCTSCGNRRKRQLRKARGLPGSKYTLTYKRKRKKFIAGKHCEFCKTTDNLTIDHIKPLSCGGKLLDVSNWRVFCYDHHKMVTEHKGEWDEPRLRHIKRYILAYKWESLYRLQRFLRKNNFWGRDFLEKKIFPG